MSIEYTATLNPPLALDELRRLRQVIASETTCKIVRESEFELGLRCNPAGIDEEVTLHLRADRVYVAFHVATREQRQAFLSAITSALRKCGVSEFEEL